MGEIELNGTNLPQKDSQISDLSLPLSDQTFKYLEDEMKDDPKVWNPGESVSVDFTALKDKSVNKSPVQNEFDDIEILKVEKQNFCEDCCLDLSVKGTALIENDRKLNQMVKSFDPFSCERKVGKFNFDIFFGESAKYSTRSETIFLKPQTTYNAVASARGGVPSGTKLFLTPLYVRANDIHDPVKTCPVHVVTSDNEASHHLIRVNLHGAVYGSFPGSNHHFVAVDFNNVSKGGSSFVLPIKFLCYSTCPGGIGRRPFKIVYWLQNGNEILGRKVMKTRICCCPGRDRNMSEQDHGVKRKFVQETSSDNENCKQMKFKECAKESKGYSINIQDYCLYSNIVKTIALLNIGHTESRCNCSQILVLPVNVCLFSLEGSDFIVRNDVKLDQLVENFDPSSSERIVGRYSFDVTFREVTPFTKAISYTYSDKLEILFVRRQATCYTVISTREGVPPGTKLFLAPLFLQQNGINSPVKACPNHVVTSDNEASRHLIRLDVDGAYYGTFPHSNHHFVAIDFHRVSKSRTLFTIPLKFLCYSTCRGGIEGRLFQVLYWLQNGSEVLGRKGIQTRICSCPGRDREFKEQEKFGSSTKTESDRNHVQETNDNKNFKRVDCKEFTKQSKGYSINVKSHCLYSNIIKLISRVNQSHSWSTCNCSAVFVVPPNLCLFSSNL